MQKEFSAGGIVFKKIGKNWNVLLLKDMNNNWTFPKGIIEEKESKIEAAIREIREETGLTHLEMIIQLPAISYTYYRERPISKTVYYFLFHTTEDDRVTPQIEEGIQAIQWTDIENAMNIIGYTNTNKPLLQYANNYIQKNL